MTTYLSQNQITPKQLVTVVTRLKTLNIGNEALSSELVRLVQNKFPNYKVCALERSPKFLDQYYTQLLSKNLSRALDKFESWAQAIAGRSPVFKSSLIDDLSPPLVTLLPRQPKTPSWKPFLDKNLHITAFRARLGFYDDEKLKRLNIYQTSAITILNPAGELNPQSIEPPLRMLLELRVAQILGSKVGVVNFSYEIPDIFISKFFTAIMNEFDFVRVRDSLSLQNLVENGLDPDKSAVISDLAFLTKSESTEVSNNFARKFDIPVNSSALVVNGKVGSSKINEWAKIALALKQNFAEVFVISNEISSDLPFFECLSQEVPVKIISEQFSYREYSALLKNFDLIISNRLHTTILSMIVGRPVIPIEPISRRIKGLMKDIDYPINVVSVFDPNWTSQVIESMNILTSDNNLIKLIPNIVEKQRNKIFNDFDFLNSLI